ncbi:MAG: hypothetical protein ACUVXI_03395 [bacterium]
MSGRALISLIAMFAMVSLSYADLTKEDLREIEGIVTRVIEGKFAILSGRIDALDAKIVELDKRLTTQMAEMDKRLTAQMAEMDRRLTAQIEANGKKIDFLLSIFTILFGGSVLGFVVWLFNYFRRGKRPTLIEDVKKLSVEELEELKRILRIV